VRAAERPDRPGGSGPSTSRRSPAKVALALLDRDSVIVSVNQAWQEFARQNGGDLGRTGIGVSYLEVCAAAENDPVAEQVGSALRSALHGDLPAPMTLRIPCPTPDREQWFDELISSRFDHTGDCVGATVTLSPSARNPQPHRTTDEMLEHAVSRLVDAQNLLDGLRQRLNTEVDQLTLTATFENLDAVIRDLRPRPQWRHR
jgi:hypothetical protein